MHSKSCSPGHRRKDVQVTDPCPPPRFFHAWHSSGCCYRRSGDATQPHHGGAGQDL